MVAMEDCVRQERRGLALDGKASMAMIEAYLVVCQLLGLRDQHGAADFALGAGEETLVLLDHVLHCGGKEIMQVSPTALPLVSPKHRHQ